MAQVSGPPVQKKAGLGWVLESGSRSWVEEGWVGRQDPQAFLISKEEPVSQSPVWMVVTRLSHSTSIVWNCRSGVGDGA